MLLGCRREGRHDDVRADGVGTPFKIDPCAFYFGKSWNSIISASQPTAIIIAG